MNPSLSQIGLLGNLLDVTALRHRVIAQNVANIDTPGYQRLEVTFEDELASAIGGGKPKVIESPNAVPRADGNSVSIDAEMSDLNKNTLLYQTAAQLLASRIATMRAAVTGR